LNTPQLSFFDDEPAQAVPPAGLMVQPQSGRPLSKKQRAFNRLVGKVDRLRTQLEVERRKLDAALVFHAEHLRHRVQRAVALRKDLIRALRPFLDDRRVSRRDKGVLWTMLAEQLDDVVAKDDGPLDDDLRALFEELEGADLAQLEQDQFDDVRTMMEAMFAEQGVKVDLSRFRPHMSEEEMAAAAAEMAAEAERQVRNAHGLNDQPRRRKTRRELKMEARAAELEELRKSSIGAVYRRLAKVLHPDLELDRDRRQEKSAVMQQVTAAYAKSDLHTLLRLEIEWNFRDETDVARLSDEKLAAYNRVLEEQAADLQAALDQLFWHPRYEPLREASGPFGFALKVDGHAEADRLDQMIANLEDALARLKTRQAIQEVRAAIRERRAADRAPY
jgi:hypothetical protein